jgi:exosortase
MSTVATPTIAVNAKRHAGFIAIILISGLASFRILDQLARYSLDNASSSHIVLIPFIAFFLLYVERRPRYSADTASAAGGTAIILAGAILGSLAYWGSIPQEGGWALSLAALALVVVWNGGFLVCYGFAAWRAAAFPLLFLLLMVPFPDAVLDRTIHALQEGSIEIAYLLFQAVGVPVARHGFLLTVPGVTIEVAKECSSIRSSMALFITCLLAAHLYLRTGWKMLVLVLLSLPLSIIKNGIRIATLTLLSIYVNPSFLHGRLHQEGGFVFFMLALLLLFPVFLWLARTEKPPRASATSAS